MNRIAYMVIRNLFRAPVWFYHIWRLGRPNDTHTEQQRYDYIRNVVKKVNKTGRVEIKVYGEENIPKENGFILFPNHQGLFDVLAIMDSCPNPLGIVVKKEASNIILIRQVIEALRGMSIDRKDVKASMKVIMKMTEDVRQGRNYVIFAEGTRSKKGNQILPFKGGTFKSAVNAQCPIVPVALIDSFKPFDMNSIKRQKVVVSFLEPLYPPQYAGLKTMQIADIVHDKIQQEINSKLG